LSICHKISVIGLAAMLAACTTSQTPIGGAPGLSVTETANMPMPGLENFAPDADTGLIRALDVIQVDVFGIPELSREVQVSANGTVDYPLVGSLVAAGQSVDEFSFSLENRLRETYVRQPDVTSRITERNEQFVTVGGQVDRPGRFPVTSSVTLMEAVAMGGGLDEYASKDEVLVFRTVGDERYIGVYNLEGIRRGNYADPAVYPNDIVMVGDSPGRQRLEEILALTTALASPLILIERLLR